MNYIQFNQSSKNASTIGIGCMRIADMSTKEADTFFRTGLDAGINFIDEADIYGGGKSEEVLGSVLQADPTLREKLFIQSKCGICDGYFDFSKEHILESVDGILTRIKTDHLDSLLLHRPDVLMDVHEVSEAFDLLYKQGKVLSFGVSNMSSGHISYLQKNLNYKLVVNQLQVSCAHTTIIDSLLHEDMLDESSIKHDSNILPYMQANNIGLQVWSPLQKGYFEGVFLNDENYKKLNDLLEEIANEYNVTADTIAYAWLLRIPCQTQVIVGTTKPERLVAASKATNITLTRKQWYNIYTSSGKILP